MKSEKNKKDDEIEKAIRAANIARYARNDALANLLLDGAKKKLEQQAEEEKKKNEGKK
jgi:hypothetical protein